MQAKELMIGDWVECTYWKPSKRLRVAEIRRVMDDETKIGVYSDEYVLIFNQREIEPIPLTTEILEKNGWVKDLYCNESYDNDECEMLSFWIGEDGKNSFWWHAGLELVIPINYVHELQRALKLCGIEKEIIL